jgi:hypothetical protein
MASTLTNTVLLLTAACAVYALWMVPFQNGLIAQLLDLQTADSHLPGSRSVRARQYYTGIKPIDNQILIMVGFFWPGIDGSRVDISLVLLDLVAQAVATWVLVTIESLRIGNRGKWYITS